MLTIEELCQEVNQVLESQKIRAPDGRTSARVTPRNVRYYRTLKLIDPPIRSQGKAVYSDAHTKSIVQIKIAQAAGKSLEDLASEKVRLRPSAQSGMRSSRHIQSDERNSDPPVVHAMLSMSSFFSVETEPELKSTDDFELGWSIRVGGVVISGSGAQPSEEQVRAVNAIFARENLT